MLRHTTWACVLTSCGRSPRTGSSGSQGQRTIRHVVVGSWGHCFISVGKCRGRGEGEVIAIDYFKSLLRSARLLLIPITFLICSSHDEIPA